RKSVRRRSTSDLARAWNSEAGLPASATTSTMPPDSSSRRRPLRTTGWSSARMMRSLFIWWDRPWSLRWYLAARGDVRLRRAEAVDQLLEPAHVPEYLVAFRRGPVRLARHGGAGRQPDQPQRTRDAVQQFPLAASVAAGEGLVQCIQVGAAGLQQAVQDLAHLAHRTEGLHQQSQLAVGGAGIGLRRRLGRSGRGAGRQVAGELQFQFVQLHRLGQEVVHPRLDA